jgi:hypothetical protein
LILSIIFNEFKNQLKTGIVKEISKISDQFFRPTIMHFFL